ncbi:hypothetical protein ACIRL2_41585 [Embleya sp. NPDC127516]|uniref:hypothetical protein n=1 Tax=Embleya sp. NPDC127516 TaxID=3363990 RepID=UPI00381FD3F6
MTDPDGAGPEAEAEHAVIARYRLAEDGFGTQHQRAAVRRVEALLIEAIGQADVGEFDGHEFGGGEIVLYAYGPDADALFAVMAPVLHALPFRPAHIVLRYGSASHPTATEQRFDV